MKRFKNKAAFVVLALFACLLIPTSSFAYVPGYISIASTPSHTPYIFQQNEFTVPLDLDPDVDYEFTASISYPTNPVAYIAIKDVTTGHVYSPMAINPSSPLPYKVSTKPGVNSLNANDDFLLIVFNASYPNTFSGGVTVVTH